MSEKTEQPTPKKLRDARKKGQVAKSREVGSAAVLIAVVAVVGIGWPFFREHFLALILLPTHFYGEPFREALGHVVLGCLIELAILSLPVILAAVSLGAAGHFFQIGFLFAPTAIKPDMNKLNPAKGLKRIFSMNSVIELVKSIIKITCLSLVIYLVIRDAIDPLTKLPHVGIQGVEFLLGALMTRIMLITIAAFIAVAAIDFYLQKYQHHKRLRMSKDEVKREYKEMEGDPLIRQKRKQLHQELAMNDAVERTAEADVVITNPTHFAVGLRYRPDQDSLPVVVTRGQGWLAKRIMARAKELDTPVLRYVPLARALYRRTRREDFIPADLIQPVAEVLRWVRNLRESTSMADVPSHEWVQQPSWTTWEDKDHEF